MSILILLVPLALILGLGALFSFLFAASRGQFDDLNTPAYRSILED